MSVFLSILYVVVEGLRHKRKWKTHKRKNEKKRNPAEDIKCNNIVIYYYFQRISSTLMEAYSCFSVSCKAISLYKAVVLKSSNIISKKYCWSSFYTTTEWRNRKRRRRKSFLKKIKKCHPSSIRWQKLI